MEPPEDGLPLRDDETGTACRQPGSLPLNHLETPAAGTSSPSGSPCQIPELALGSKAGRAVGHLSLRGQGGSSLQRAQSGAVSLFQTRHLQPRPLDGGPGMAGN